MSARPDNLSTCNAVITNEDVNKYIHDSIIKGGKSASFQSVTISALKKFYNIVQNIYIDIGAIRYI